MKAILAALLTALLTVCSAVGAPPVTRPTTILIIRHGEKPEAAGDADLSPQGVKRAEALPGLFQKSDGRPDPFPTPDFIFASKKSDESNRPVETVTPLAKKLGLDINSKYKDKDHAKLAADLLSDPKYDGKTVLICWHHGQIPALAADLGVTDAPAKWDPAVFSQVWVVTFDGAGKAKPLVVRPQALLPDDPKQ